jgi:hypothetical protein
MPLDAATLGDVEDALAECFNYHNALDSFIIRSGISFSTLSEARVRADRRKGAYQKAPKRFVVQELINILSVNKDGDILLSRIITSLINGNFPDATIKANNAIKNLNSIIQKNKKERRDKIEEEKINLQRQESSLFNAQHRECLSFQKKRDSLRDEFLSLCGECNHQQRGYLLEKFLHKLFEVERLDPKASFKIVGEQIDGSFIWNSHVHLVEAKWVSSPVAGAEFGAFIYKLSGKTMDTHGLYIAINGYSPEAVSGLKGKGELRFVCIDGAHILRSLEVGQCLEKLLNTIWRHASQTGEAYLPVSHFSE